MARTATATRSGKGTRPKGGKTAPATKKKKRRAPNGQGADKKTQTELLATVRANDPGITAADYAERFNLPMQDTLRLQGFAREYVRDYNIRNAAMRLGYPVEVAYASGEMMLFNSYTQLFLAELVAAANVETVVTQGQILARAWQEANAPDVFGSSGAGTRIAALGLCARILGLGQAKPPPPPPPAVAVGVMIVPGYAAPEDWEAHAREQQRALKGSVLVDAQVISSRPS